MGEHQGGDTWRHAAGQSGQAPRQLERRRLLRKVLQVSVVRTLYLSARFRGQIVVFHGTRVRLGAGARILVDPGGRLLLGGDAAGGGAGSCT